MEAAGGRTGEGRERRGETSGAEGSRADEPREATGAETTGRVGRLSEGVLVEVCVECGRQYTFDEEAPPDDLTCEKCGNTVFRAFFAPTSPDDVESDYEATTGRDLAPDDSPSEVTPSDIRDLDHL